MPNLPQLHEFISLMTPGIISQTDIFVRKTKKQRTFPLTVQEKKADHKAEKAYILWER